jgi:catechol 2,3-dioxygenase
MALDPRSHVGSVALRAADAESVAGLYEGGVGLRRMDGEPGRIVLGNDRPLLTLIESPSAPPAAQGAAGLFHTAIRFPTRAGLAATLRRVAKAGYRLTGASDHGVSEALYLDDPEGNGVELYWDRPHEAWPMAPDGTVAMFTAPLDLRDLLLEPDEGIGVDGADIGHAHLKVTDVERAVDFWGRTLGMNLRARYGADAAFMAAGEYHHHIGLNVWMSRGGPPAPEDARGLERVVLALPDAAALDAAVVGLRAAGHEVQDGADGAKLVRDPDQILVELRPAA